MKKGRHRRFEEARALKRSTEPRVEPCPECGALPDDEHASWCLHDEVDEVDDDDGGEDGDGGSGPDIEPGGITGPPGDIGPQGDTGLRNGE